MLTNDIVSFEQVGPGIWFEYLGEQNSWSGLLVLYDSLWLLSPSREL